MIDAGSRVRRLADQTRVRLGTQRAKMRTPLLWPHRLLATRLGWGRQPDFIIVGAQRCGSRSLYRCLTRHPDVGSSRAREVHYFDLNFTHSVEWYESYFPLQIGVSGPRLVGEKSPYYFFHPHAARRIGETLPEVKLMVLVRNPVDRAVSHYRSNVVLGLEDRDLADALEEEPAMLARETERIATTPNYNSFPHRHHSYFSRGEYAGQLRRLGEHVSEDRIHVVKSERLFDNPDAEMTRVYEFLGLDGGAAGRWEHLNRAHSQTAIDGAVIDSLKERYRQPNEQLASLVNFSIEDWA